MCEVWGEWVGMREGVEVWDCVQVCEVVSGFSGVLNKLFYCDSSWHIHRLRQ